MVKMFNHKNAGGENDTQSSEHNAQRKESETTRNNSNSEDKEDGSEEEGNTQTTDGHSSDNKITPPKNSTARKPNQCWCGLVYDSNQDVEDHIKLDHANNSYICSKCKPTTWHSAVTVVTLSQAALGNISIYVSGT